MIRPLAGALVLAASTCIAPAAPVPTHLMPKEPPPFFPTKVGAKWVWQSGGREDAEVVTEVLSDLEGDGLCNSFELDVDVQCVV